MRSQRTFQQMRPGGQARMTPQPMQPQMAPPLRAGPPQMQQMPTNPNMQQFNQAQQGQMEQWRGQQMPPGFMPPMQGQPNQTMMPMTQPIPMGPTGAPGIMAPAIRRTY